MGGIQSSRSMVSNQETLNNINNVSTQNCITECTSNISNTNIDIEHSTFNGDINVQSICTITGASCLLKSAMTNSLHNTEKSEQELKDTEENDPFNVIPLALFGSDTSDSKSVNQSIVNRVSNVINATCQNNSTSNISGTTVTVSDATVNGNININAKGDVDKSSCVQNNVASNIITNNEQSKQKDKVFQGSPLLFIIVAVTVVIIGGLLVILVLGITGIIGFGVFESSGGSKSLPPGAMQPGMIPPMQPGMRQPMQPGMIPPTQPPMRPPPPAIRQPMQPAIRPPMRPPPPKARPRMAMKKKK